MRSVIRGLIFDFDGTTAISEDVHGRAWDDLAAAWDKPLPEDFKQSGIGHTDAELATILSLAWVCENRMAEILQQKRIFYQQRAPMQSVLNPGIKELMDHFKNQYSFALATAASHGDIKPTLDRYGLYPYYQSVVAIEDVEFSKPDPECYLLSAKNLGLKPAECLAFEDTFIGAESARRAGMAVVALTTSYTVERIGPVAGAMKNFTDIAYVEEIIKKL